MKIDFGASILDLDGEPLMEGENPITLAAVSVNALLATLTDAQGQPEQLSGEDKVKSATLAQAIHTVGTVDLEAEQVALLKGRIGRLYGPLLVMQAWNLLDPKEGKGK